MYFYIFLTMKKITKSELEDLRTDYYQKSEHNSPDDLLELLEEELELDYDEDYDAAQAFHMAILPYYSQEDQKENEQLLIEKGWIIS